MMAIRPGRSTKLLVAAVGGVLLVAGLIGVILLRTTGVGTGGLQRTADRLEDWLGSQIVGIANSYLVPQLAYESIDYQAPGTLVLGTVTLTSPDGTRVLELGEMTVTLAEVPKIGEPIAIEQLTLERPTIRLVREQRADGSGGFKGLSPIVRNAPTRDENVEESFRLSNVLRLRRIAISEGSFLYDQGDGSPVMSITGFTTDVDASPDPEEPGWYTLDIASAVGPLADLTVKGRLSLDTFVAELSAFTFAGELSPDTSSALPPQLQSLVQQYEATGTIELGASGRVPLTSPLGASLKVDLGVRGLRVASGDYQVPVESLDAEATLADGLGTLTSLTASLLEGRIDAHGDVQLSATGRPVHLFWSATDIELRELLRTDTAAEGPPKLAGKLTGTGSATANAASAARDSLAGSGEVHVREGRLVMLPVLRQLAAAMDIATGSLLRGALDHRADVVFELQPTGVVVTSSEVRTEFFAARGTGTIGFDGTLNLTLNGGPMEKLQSLLGKVGDVLGAVTDRLVRYRVRGTLSEPTVSIDPLGVGG